VMRRDFDPRPHLLPQGGGEVVQGLLAGMTLRDAVSAAGTHPDPVGVLTVLLAQGAIVGIRE
jgi:hypothetical protein